MRIRFLCGSIVPKQNITEYFHLSNEQAIEMFLPDCYKYTTVDKADQADICIVGTQHTDNSLLRDNEINIFFTVENFKVGRQHYKHFNTFDRHNNPKIRYYLYNDISYPEQNAFPIVAHRIQYFLKIHNTITVPPILHEKKHFCIFVSRNMLNPNKSASLQTLSKFGKVHHISQYNIKHVSCYNSNDILQVLSRYKFVLCFENSNTNGYCTEKIFNVFLSSSIPIYDGPPDVIEYLNKDSFIQYDNNGRFLKTVELLMNKSDSYNEMLKQPKINKKYDYNKYTLKLS